MADHCPQKADTVSKAQQGGSGSCVERAVSSHDGCQGHVGGPAERGEGRAVQRGCDRLGEGSQQLVGGIGSSRPAAEARAAALRTGATVPSGGISFGKRVGEGTSIAIERFTDVAIHDQIVGQLALVDAALARLDDGTYGTCQVCGKAIAPERLEVIPWAATCVACA